MNLSKDYEELYKQIHQLAGEKIPCFVDYRYRSQPEDGTPFRDVAAVRILGDDIDVGARGISYLSVEKDNVELFVKWCDKLNIEWVV